VETIGEKLHIFSKRMKRRYNLLIFFATKLYNGPLKNVRMLLFLVAAIFGINEVASHKYNFNTLLCRKQIYFVLILLIANHIIEALSQSLLVSNSTALDWGRFCNYLRALPYKYIPTGGFFFLEQTPSDATKEIGSDQLNLTIRANGVTIIRYLLAGGICTVFFFNFTLGIILLIPFSVGYGIAARICSSIEISLLSAFLNLLTILINGVILKLIVSSFSTNQISLARAAIIYQISWCLGFVVILLPGGLGVRDSSIIYFLNKSILSVDSISASMTLRMLQIFVEFFLGTAFSITSYFRRLKI
jgi:hypothetical protein